MDSNYECFLDGYKVIKLDKTDYNFISFINDSNGFDENAIFLPLLSGQDIDRFSKDIKVMKQDMSEKNAMNEIYKYLLSESNDLDLQFQKEKANKLQISTNSLASHLYSKYFIFFYHRKNHKEAASSCPAIFHFNSSVMDEQDPVRQRQTKPVSFFFVSGIRLIKFLKNPF